MTVWHNGHLVEDVSISAFDPVFSGMGAFETLLAVKGRAFAWARHRERLVQSLQLLSIPVPDLSEMALIIGDLLERNKLAEAEARVRITISGQTSKVTQMIVTVQPYERSVDSVRLATSITPVNADSPLRQVKSLSYAENWLFHQEAESLELDDVLIANTSGSLAEASMSNVIIRHQGILKTPPLSAGCLPGVTRALLMEMESAIIEEEIPMSFLTEAEEVWLCNSLRRLQFATELDGRKLAKPSGHFHDLSEALETLIYREL